VEEPANEPLVRRVERLEDGQLDTRERLARLETRVEDIAAQMVTKTEFAALSVRVDAIAGQMVTKAEFAALSGRVDALGAQMATRADIEALNAKIASFETSLLKWMIGTAVALASLAFAAGRFIR
jgi:BMFP domain-containing protein YqiC